MSQGAEYKRGFDRVLRLLRLVSAGPAPLYSPDFYAALRRYFDDGGYGDHPRFADWWKDHDGGRICDALTGFCPWIAGHVDLGKANVLEIGCGTGSSTVALACHGAHVVACDMHLPSLDVARIRLVEEGLEKCVDIRQISSDFKELRHERGRYDLVVLYAVLEHMLPAERGAVIDIAWNALKEGGAIAVYETPNRWAWRDRHTTNLIAWGWLRPQWALRYGVAKGKFPKGCSIERMYREGFGSSYNEITGFLAGRQYTIDAPYQKPRFVRRALLKVARTLLRVPHWAFAEYFSLLIHKQTQQPENS